MKTITNENEIILEDGNGHALGHVSFKIQDGVLVLEHTIVEESERGKGIGQLLISATINYVKENNLLIKPVCSYAAAYFAKRKEYSSLIAK